MQAAERGPQHDGRREGEQHQAGQRHPYVRERGRRSHEPLGRRHEDKNPEAVSYTHLTLPTKLEV